MFNVFYRAHECLGACPVPLGPPPHQMCETQSASSPLDFRIKFYVEFDVGLGSFGGLSWAPLRGSSSFVLALFHRLIFQKVVLHEIISFPILLGPSGSHMAPPKRPRSLQDGSLILLDRFFSILDFRFDFGSF